MLGRFLRRRRRRRRGRFGRRFRRRRFRGNVVIIRGRRRFVRDNRGNTVIR